MQTAHRNPIKLFQSQSLNLLSLRLRQRYQLCGFDNLDNGANDYYLVDTMYGRMRGSSFVDDSRRTPWNRNSPNTSLLNDLHEGMAILSFEDIRHD